MGHLGDLPTTGVGSVAALASAGNAILPPISRLTLLECLSAADQAACFAALADAVAVLKAKPQVAGYIAAGHSNWLAPQTVAQRLNASGIARADGFALNVTNFPSSSNEVAYGRRIAALFGNKHFVIDTSRSGVGPVDGPNSRCNPTGQALGHRSAVVEDIPLLGAFLWIKRPGESAGACNGSPPAGQ